MKYRVIRWGDKYYPFVKRGRFWSGWNRISIYKHTGDETSFYFWDKTYQNGKDSCEEAFEIIQQYINHKKDIKNPPIIVKEGTFNEE